VSYSVRSCVICGSHAIESRWISARRVTTTCRVCGRIIRTEFDPPDEPDIRGRIEVVFDPAMQRQVAEDPDSAAQPDDHARSNMTCP